MSHRPRLSIDITPEQQRFLQRLPHGWKQQIFSALVEMLMEMTERLGMRSLSAVAAKAIKLEDVFEEKD